MTWENFPIAPQTDEEKKDCETPDGIRRRLRKVYYHHSDPIIHNVMCMSEASGLTWTLAPENCIRCPMIGLRVSVA